MNLQEKDLYWLAGIFEGEAYFQIQTEKIPVGITIEMTDEDIIERITDITGNSYCKVKTRQPHHKQSFKTTVRGKSAIELMKLILPIMGERRSNKIKDCINSYKIKSQGKLIPDQISEIKERFSKGEKPKIIALDYNITHWRVYQLVR